METRSEQQKGIDIDSVAEILSILTKEENQLAMEALRKQFQKISGIAEAAAQLRLTVLDFMDWKERRILWHPWLLFKRQDYWGKRFDEFCRGRLEQAVTTELWKTVKLGKTISLTLQTTIFLDLAAKMANKEGEQ